ncbi:hypothetical protein C1646_707643, partial [Rhizophagus diaphanus]
MMNDATSEDYSRSYNHNLTNNALGDSTSTYILDIPTLTYTLEDSTSSNLNSQNHNLPNYAFEYSTLPSSFNLMNYDYVLGSTDPFEPGYIILMYVSTLSDEPN